MTPETKATLAAMKATKKTDAPPVKPAAKTEVKSDAGSFKTKDVAAAMGITPKALRKQLRAQERWADKRYTNYRFATVEEVVNALKPKATTPATA